MIRGAVFPGRYVQGAGAIVKLASEIARLGRSPLIIVDPYVADHVVPNFGHSEIDIFQNHSIKLIGGECCEKEISRISQCANSKEADVIVGVGGGKTIDVAKVVALRRKAATIIVPTIASTDAPCSAQAVVYSERGMFEKAINLPRNPDSVIVDSGIIANAPVRLLVSGMGDALSTWFEASSCYESCSNNTIGAKSTQMAQIIARACYETLIEHCESAKRDCESHFVSHSLEEVIEANTLLSGIGFESGGLATAHSVHNGLTSVYRTKEFFHGEKVAFGVLVSLFLTSKPSHIVDEVFSFCMKVGLPTTLEEIGLENITQEELRLIADNSCKLGEEIHNEHNIIDKAMVRNALVVADSEGKLRKANTQLGERF